MRACGYFVYLRNDKEWCHMPILKPNTLFYSTKNFVFCDNLCCIATVLVSRWNNESQIKPTNSWSDKNMFVEEAMNIDSLDSLVGRYIEII